MTEIVQFEEFKKVRAAGGGRKKSKPLDEKALAGEVFVKVPPVPEEIQDDEVASAQWKIYAPVLVKRKILKRQHLPQLSMMCQQYSVYTNMMAKAAVEGYTIDAAEGSKKSNPTYLVALKAQIVYERLCSLFMLDPTSEKRFQRAEEVKEAENPFNNFKAGS
jgi:P27 family predicted phage terminase small subunit